ncbi:MAG: hypothetical protein HQ581_15820 [Planctomycetes bacterium]|nr:hypothetical protein [Planctomycetota bacterium]
MMGLPSFVVAAPEGMWAYSLSAAKEKLEAELPPNHDKADEEKFRNTIVGLQKKAAR